MGGIDHYGDPSTLWYNKYIVKSVKKEAKPVVAVKPKKVVVKKTEEVKKYTEEELFDMKKAEQVALLKKFGVSTIPRFEKQRVSLILAKQ